MCTFQLVEVTHLYIESNQIGIASFTNLYYAREHMGWNSRLASCALIINYIEKKKYIYSIYKTRLDMLEKTGRSS